MNYDELNRFTGSLTDSTGIMRFIFSAMAQRGWGYWGGLELKPVSTLIVQDFSMLSTITNNGHLKRLFYYGKINWT